MRQGFSQLVLIYILATSTVCVALRCRSLRCSPPPRPRCQRVECGQLSISRHYRSWRRFPVGVNHSWWWRPYESSSNFSLTGPIFLLVPSHFARIMTNISPYSASTEPSLLFFFKFSLFRSLLQKPPTSAMSYADWFNCRNVTRHGLTSDACIALRFLLRIFM